MGHLCLLVFCQQSRTLGSTLGVACILRKACLDPNLAYILPGHSLFFSISSIAEPGLHCLPLRYIRRLNPKCPLIQEIVLVVLCREPYLVMCCR